nr:hypothetical protein [Tanacetum cinerariifolium]
MLSNLDVDDMLKAQIKVIDILCNLELIYPLAFFDIIIHLVIHLPLEAIDGGLIRPRWMYPFERFMKKLKNYVLNKAKPEGSIAEGYVAEEALTFSSHYFRDVTTKFNRPDRNVDYLPLTCHFQVFKSLCKSIGLWSFIRIDHQELKKVIWYILHNSPEIDTYQAKFKSEFPNKDMKEDFLRLVWEADNDPAVSESSELFALAYGPSQTSISVNSCIVNDVSLNDLEIMALHIDGQSIDVDTPPDIIDVDEDDDIIDEEDPIPHDLAYFIDEDSSTLILIMIDSGGDDRLPPYQIPIGCEGCLGNRGKSTQKPNLGGRRAGRMHTRQETRNLRLKAITDKNGLVPIQFEFGDRETLMPLGDYVAHWANYLGEVVRELPLHYPSWRQLPPERLAGSWQRLRQKIYASIQQHLQKIYNGKKAALKERYWDPDEDGAYDVERIRRGRSNTPLGVPNTDDEIIVIVHKGKQRRHILGVGRVLSRHGTVISPQPPCTHSFDVAKLKKSEKLLTKHVNMFMELFRSDAKFSQMLTQLESRPEYGGGSGSGGCEDDEPEMMRTATRMGRMRTIVRRCR